MLDKLTREQQARQQALAAAAPVEDAETDEAEPTPTTAQDDKKVTFAAKVATFAGDGKGGKGTGKSGKKGAPPTGKGGNAPSHR